MLPSTPDLGVPTVSSAAIYSVTTTKNITYAEGLSHQSINSEEASVMSLELDAYVPDNEIENRPAILLIHGGGFIGGSKEAGAIVSLANYFASRGWVAFSINYRLRDDYGTVPDEWISFAENSLLPAQRGQFLAIYPAHRDAKAAIRWLYANAESYNINTNYITVGGGSAGAVTSVTMGVTDTEDYTEELSEAEDFTLATTHLDQPTEVHSILDFWGSGVGVNILEEVYGIQRFDTGDAPIIIMHGTGDPTVLFSEGEALKDNYTTTGVDFEFYPLEGRGHGAWNATVDGKTLEELSYDFVIEQQGLRVQ